MSGGPFNPPPNWPVPPGWQPPPGWAPDPAWPPAPVGWQFWPGAAAPSAPPPRSRQALLWALGAAVTIVAVVIGVVAVVHGTKNRNPEVIVLRPVDAQGNVQSGWQEKTEDRGSSRLDCSYGEASPYDVGSSVRFCGGTADSADACWPATDTKHVLCLRDPFTKVIDLVPARGLKKPRKTAQHPYRPFALVLDNGRHCRARIGGAWGRPQEHPDWVGYFGCGSSTSDFSAVWAAPDESGPGDGITRNDDGWSVMVGGEKGPLTSHRVTQVFYVGVAGEHDAVNR